MAAATPTRTLTKRMIAKFIRQAVLDAGLEVLTEEGAKQYVADLPDSSGTTERLLKEAGVHIMGFGGEIVARALATEHPEFVDEFIKSDNPVGDSDELLNLQILKAKMIKLGRRLLTEDEVQELLAELKAEDKEKDVKPMLKAQHTALLYVLHKSNDRKGTLAKIFEKPLPVD